ncbi:indole-3-glycerol phosphate synthase TrpC [Edaphobacter sp. 12200R-103]|uniref:indole-3-glycerol phosphate synthase TrpC n=1 Tax=Edaphobacter sp. 12200R-103 TaxID=2703788 RepID=UPI00138C76EA|nr:indole-3-glycerol phosphate synthase TrpC [Edaphobacter sp. 12200R-103]QHS53307.1 indole-3-glycerol phosphate synthase TrpC [Edaphobacter sp. 12200R-103]
MPTRLDEIVANTSREVAERKAVADKGLIEQRAAAHTPRGFAARLKSVSQNGPAMISEIKKASPSKGLIREDFDPLALAKGFEAGGAAALSILTDTKYFQGSLAYLEAASQAVKIPCLRKDFIVDPFQMVEARAFGADAILLIVAVHTDTELASLRKEAHNYALDVLCEVHSSEELKRAVDLGFDVIGVNSRDLRTFEMHPELLFELVDAMPAGTVKVAESGLRGAEEIAKLRDAGYDAFLMGETLMRQPDPGVALAELLRHGYSERVLR